MALEKLSAVFKYIKGAYKKDGERLLTRVCSDRATVFKLKGSFRLGIRKKFLMMRVVRHSGTGHPEKLWMPRPWRCSRPGWMGLWAT